MSEWEPQHVVDAGLAARLIANQMPELAGRPVEPLAEGWDNTVHLVDDRLIFRFPRREIALPGVEREITVLPTLAARLPLPVPEPLYVGRASPDFPWPWWGGAHLPGVELADSGLADDDRIAMGGDVGRFLNALHDPAFAERPEVRALPYDVMRRGDAAARAERAQPRLAALVDQGVWSADPAVDRLLRSVPPDLRLPSEHGWVVTHGDLHVRHLLVAQVDGVARATGVIDWGDLCRADPAVDLLIAYSGFAGAARAALLTAYDRPVPPERELRARVLAVFLSATLLAYAAAEGRAALRVEALAGLRRAVT